MGSIYRFFAQGYYSHLLMCDVVCANIVAQLHAYVIVLYAELPSGHRVMNVVLAD